MNPALIRFAIAAQLLAAAACHKKEEPAGEAPAHATVVSTWAKLVTPSTVDFLTWDCPAAIEIPITATAAATNTRFIINLSILRV